LGHDVAAERQGRKAEAVAKIEAGTNAIAVAALADEYFEGNILGRWKHPNIGRLTVEGVRHSHIGRHVTSHRQAGRSHHRQRRAPLDPAHVRFCGEAAHGPVQPGRSL
jgi:hypothetical protein